MATTAASGELGELVNKPLAEPEAEDPISKTPASVKPSARKADKIQPAGNSTGGRAASRERKKVDFFAPAEVKQTEKLVIKEGGGQRLGDIPNILFRLQKTTGRADLLEGLHTILFNRKGKLSTRKKDIQNFSGFTYSEADKEAELKKDEEKLNRWKTDHINQLLDLLDLPRGKDDDAKKESKIKRILEFLEAPKKLGTKDLHEQDAKKKAQIERKRKREAKTAEKKQRAEARADKKAEKASKKADKAEKRKAEGGQRPRKKAKVESEDEEEDEEEEREEEAAESDSEDDLPLCTASKMPSDAELEQACLAILKGVDVINFSLKQLLAHLEERYKIDFSKLKSKKQLIKQVAIMYCSAQGPPADDDDDDADETAAEPAVQEELEPEAKEQIMGEAGIPKEEQQDVSMEDAVAGVPAADARPAPPAEEAAKGSLEDSVPVPNVNFTADNA